MNTFQRLIIIIIIIIGLSSLLWSFASRKHLLYRPSSRRISLLNLKPFSSSPSSSSRQLSGGLYLSTTCLSTPLSLSFHLFFFEPRFALFLLQFASSEPWVWSRHNCEQQQAGKRRQIGRFSEESTTITMDQINSRFSFSFYFSRFSYRFTSIWVSSTRLTCGNVNSSLEQPNRGSTLFQPPVLASSLKHPLAWPKDGPLLIVIVSTFLFILAA